MHRPAGFIASLCAALLLAACGDSRAPGPAASATPPPAATANAAPGAPALVELSSLAVGQLTASWVPPADDSTSAASLRYQVHASPDAGFVPSPDTLKFEGRGVASATLSAGLTPGTRYTVLVVVIDEQSASSSSNRMSVTVSDTPAVLRRDASVRTLDAGQLSGIAADTVQLAAGVAPPAPGQFLVSGEGDGMLRRVVAVSGGTLQTSPAALNQLLEEAAISTSVSLRAVAPAAGARTPADSATLRTSSGNGRAELHWPETGLRLSSAVAPPASPGVRTRASTARATAEATAGATIDTSAKRAIGGKGRWATLDAPDTVGILAGTSGSFDVVGIVDRDDSDTGATPPTRIPLAVCKVEEVSSDLGRSAVLGTPTVAASENVTSNGRLFAAPRRLVQPVLLNVSQLTPREEPYLLRLRLYVDEAQNGCEPGLRRLLGWKDELEVQVRIVVASTPSFPKGESKSLQFSGDFSVDNTVTFTFDPTLDADFTLAGARLSAARLQVRGRAEFLQELSILASGAGRLDKTANLLAERRFVKVLTAGPVPVVLSGTFSIDMRIQGEVTGSISATEIQRFGLEDLAYGFSYQGGTWRETSPSLRQVHEFTVEGESQAQARLTVTLLPRLSLRVYESVTGRLVLAPYLLAEAGIKGKVLSSNVDGAITRDADAWLDKARVTSGVKGYAMADASILDFAVLTFPSGADPADHTSFYPFVLAGETDILGIPLLEAKPDASARHPSDSRAVLFAGKASEVLNPFRALFGPRAFITFTAWTAPRVVAANDAGYAFVQPHPDALPGDTWVRFTQPGSYTVRLAGYSSMGSWARQIAEATFVVADANGNAIADYWEQRYGLAGSGEQVAAADPDGDGRSNLQEWQAGTDPTVADGSVVTPPVAQGFPPVLSCGDQGAHTLALGNDGTVWAWGRNETGQLGDGSLNNRSAAAPIPGLGGITAVAAGVSHSLFLGPDGRVSGVGSDAGGELGAGAAAPLGYRTSPVLATVVPAAVSIAAGKGPSVLHPGASVAATASGAVRGWGHSAEQSVVGNIGGVAGSDYAGFPAAAAVEADSRGSLLVVGKDGSLWFIGTDLRTLGAGVTTPVMTPTPMPGIDNVQAVAMGSFHVLALKRDGTVWSWGSAGLGYTVPTGQSPNTPRQIPGLDSIVRVAASQTLSMALRSDGTVFVWGRNVEGQLGLGVASANTSFVVQPTAVPGLGKVRDICAGWMHSVFALEDGSVWAAGDNRWGQLGNATVQFLSYAPVPVTGLTLPR